MKRRITGILLAFCLILTVFPTTVSALTSEQEALYQEFAEEWGLSQAQTENMQSIYSYLTTQMGLNRAAASGLMANIYRDSRFDPDPYDESVDSGAEPATIGILQWEGEERTAEMEWCIEAGYDPYSLDGQLAYLNYQLQTEYPDTYHYLQSVEDSAEGAYEAGWYFSYYFEVPDSREITSNSRGTLAGNSFYPFLLEVDGLSDGGGSGDDDDDNDNGGGDEDNPDPGDGGGDEDNPDPGDGGGDENTPDPGDDNGDNNGDDDTDPGNDEDTDPVIVLPFEDIEAGSWYYDDVGYAYANGMFSGVSATEFAPEQTMTRAQVVQVLYNMNGKPAISYRAYFTDVERDVWYTSAIVWARSNGIVNGTSATTFAPNDTVTREQMAQILYNYYTEYLGNRASGLMSIRSFSDWEQVTFGTAALQWTVGNGIINGITDNGVSYLWPRSGCTRAQGCVMLVRFVREFG
ncbi:MAG: phage tail tip lysozyme [Oscillospiraceae bacterium]|nr:phage tail tip lysozyme [Oscillospiraceae bacterium]